MGAGFQIPETTGTIGRYRTPLVAISGLWGASFSWPRDRWVPMVADGSGTVLTHFRGRGLDTIAMTSQTGLT